MFGLNCMKRVLVAPSPIISSHSATTIEVSANCAVVRSDLPLEVEVLSNALRNIEIFSGILLLLCLHSEKNTGKLYDDDTRSTEVKSVHSKLSAFPSGNQTSLCSISEVVVLPVCVIPRKK